MMMDESADTPTPPSVPVDVALCIDQEVYARLRPVLRHLCVGLIDWNVAIRVVTPSPDMPSLVFGPIQLTTYDSPSWPLSWVRRLRQPQLQDLLRKLADRRPTTVHAVSGGSFDVAHTLAETFGADLVLQFTSFNDLHVVKPVWMEQAGHCIASSQPIYDEVTALPGARRDRVSLIRPGVLAGATPTCFSRTERMPSLLCTEPLRPGCGVDHLLQAVRMLRDRKWEFLSFITGTGPMEAELRKQAQQLGLLSTVVFARPMGDTSSLMIGADLYVEPTANPALTSGPLHAMANGMAVVAVEGGVADHFVDGVNAVVCPDDSPTELAGAVERLLADQQGAANLARGAIAHMKQHHPISAMVEQTLAVYQSLILRAKTFPLEKAQPRSEAASPQSPPP